jgi:hypothetical protein
MKVRLQNIWWNSFFSLFWIFKSVIFTKLWISFWCCFGDSAIKTWCYDVFHFGFFDFSIFNFFSIFHQIRTARSIISKDHYITVDFRLKRKTARFSIHCSISINIQSRALLFHHRLHKTWPFYKPHRILRALSSCLLSHWRFSSSI